MFLLLLPLVFFLVLSGCVSKKKWLASQASVEQLRRDSTALAEKSMNLQTGVNDLKHQNELYQQQVEKLRQQAENLSKEAADKIATQQALLNSSKEELADKEQRLQALYSLLEQQKKNADALREKIAEALVKFNASELTVSKKNGKVYVSLQENLLFPSASAVVNPKGKEALGKLAEVLNNNPDINVNIEGHTDSLPIRTKFEDNWALSTARAAAIVRILTKDYKVNPVKVLASGHSSFDPVDSNQTAEGRARNRRTEIILTPDLDQLYKLINGEETVEERVAK